MAQELGRERAQLERVVQGLHRIDVGVSDAMDLLELAREENEPELLESLQQDLARVEQKLTELEFRRMFSGEMDASNAFLDIQSGSGGTEAQAGAEMLLRMYLRYCER